MVCALKVAQGELLSAVVGRRCLYLVDDLPAELDSQNRQRVMKHLLTLGSQLFVTSVEAEAIDLNAFHDAEITRFHVERGTISRLVPAYNSRTAGAWATQVPAGTQDMFTERRHERREHAGL